MEPQTQDPADADQSTEERRSEERITTVFKPVVVRAEGFTGFGLMRNLSANGAMVDVYTELIEGEAVELELGDGKTSGKVTWYADGRIGVTFDEPVDVAARLSALSSAEEGKVNRAPRLDLACDGELIIESRSVAMRLQNISQRGLRALTSFVRVGDVVEVQLSGMERRKAAVRWAEDGMAGMNFLRPLGFEELALWVLDQQARLWSSSGRAGADLHQVRTG